MSASIGRPATSALIDLVCIPFRAAARSRAVMTPCEPCDCENRRISNRSRAAREPRSGSTVASSSELIRSRRTESLFQPSDSKMVGLGWPPNRTREAWRRQDSAANSRGIARGRYQRWAHLRGVWEFLANVQVHALQLGVHRGGRPTLGLVRGRREDVLAHAPSSRVARQDRDTPPRRIRADSAARLAHHGERATRGNDETTTSTSTRPRLNCQSTTCTLGTREQGEMLGCWEFPCLGAPPRPAPAPSASRLLLLGASRLRSRRHLGRAPLSPLERGPRPTGRPRALPLVRGRHRQSIYGREQILTG